MRAAAKAAAVGAVPAWICLVNLGGAGPVAVVFLAVLALFVVLMTAWEVCREMYWPAVPARPSEPDGPAGVLSQAGAAERIGELTADLWERDRWRS